MGLGEKMKIRELAILMSLLLVSININAATINGIATKGENNTQDVGQVVNGKIKYFIPLSQGAAGRYGTDTNVGISSDFGSGYGYNQLDAGSLEMILYFDLSVLQGKTGKLTIGFDDLDLSPINDPDYFFEDIEFAMSNGNGFSDIGGNIRSVLQLSQLPDSWVSQTNPNFDLTIEFHNLQNVDGNDYWTGQQSLWVQLLFGVKTDPLQEVWNTPELLLGSTVSNVPVPAAVWLFGSALIGLFGYARKRS